MPPPSELASLRERLLGIGPHVRAVLGELARDLVPEVSSGSPRGEKKFNDPIWKTITLRTAEIALIEIPLLQRLRRVRQLGLAYLVYPSAHHTRFEHSLGAVHVASRMCALLRDLPIDPEIEAWTEAVRLAALLHDCGHTAFSHVGERALGKRNEIASEFAMVKRILNEAFVDDVRDALDEPAVPQRTSARLATHGPPIAELISVLFILSERMENFLMRQGVRHEDIMLVAALVMGRPYRFERDGPKHYNDFVKSIVSGDLDADKLDYVARDAYFTGIPIAADVDRLISQLALVAHDVRLPDGREIKANLLGLQPSGVSAFEMFVMTRSYMFSRVYQHPKVRVAERRLTRAISDTFSSFTGDAAPIEVMRLLYGINGDDACTDDLDRRAKRGDADALPFAMEWRHAKRVLALSPRNMVGYDDQNGLSSDALISLWANASTELNNDSSAIEAKIAGVLDIAPDKVIIDWQRPPIIKENPAIFVQDPFSTELRPIGRAFDIGQLAKAYEDARSLAWIFVDHPDPAQGAAAAATVLNDEFGLVPRIASVTEAKIHPDKFRSAIRRLAEREDIRLLAMSAEGIDRQLEGGLYVSPRMVASYLVPLGDDAAAKAIEFSERLKKSALTQRQFNEVIAALGVLSPILKFIETTAAVQATYTLSLDEAEFQKEVHFDLRRRLDLDQSDRITREGQSPTGRLDLTVSIAKQQAYPVVLELKAEESKFSTSVQRNLLQLKTYLTDQAVSRVGVLFVRFRSSETVRMTDLVQLHVSAGGMVVFAVGQHVPPTSASKMKGIRTKAPRP